MEYFNILLIGLFLFFVIRNLAPIKGIRNITTVELKNELKDNTKQFIDVRTEGEYRSNHIQSFMNIPLHDIKKMAIELDPNQEVVIICQSGMRSLKASRILKKLGFHKITNVKGGMSSWRR